MKTITITGYKRPQLFRRLLASLAANDLSGWHIHAQIEPTPAADEFTAAAREILQGRHFTVTINPERLGVRLNPFTLLDSVFNAGSLFNIYLEEDMVVSPDTTALADWFAAHQQPDWLCLSLLAGGCGSSGLISDSDHPDQLFLSKAFNSLGFAVTRERWQQIFKPCWMVDDPNCCAPAGESVKGWDWAIYFRLFMDAKLQTVQPVLARATHTGREGGEHCDANFHDLAFGDLPIAGALAGAAAYRLVNVKQLAPAVRRHVLLWQQTARSLKALAVKENTINTLRTDISTMNTELATLRPEIVLFRHFVTTSPPLRWWSSLRLSWLLKLARRTVRRQDWARAARAYREVLALAPGQADVWVQYGDVLEHAGQHELARAAYREAEAIATSIAAN